ncbi:MAG: hypothetical protein K1X36_09260 [Pyrinomonadaceae bacterium]|nr:hypothetical protein [Pyrinomonadaceae bacterium]
MTDASDFRSIVDMYVKHGWIPRRVLLSAALRKELTDKIAEYIPESQIVEREIDAAWFSRPPSEGPIAWEIRSLGSTPYALVEHLDEIDPGFEAALATVEKRFAAAVAARRSA